jgi:hypothetical protein
VLPSLERQGGAYNPPFIKIKKSAQGANLRGCKCVDAPMGWRRGFKRKDLMGLFLLLKNNCNYQQFISKFS